VRRDELASDVLALLPELDVPPECLADRGSFDAEVDRALGRLLRAGWIDEADEPDARSFAPREVAEDVLAWIRARLARDARSIAAFDRLDVAVTQRVLADYGAARTSRRPTTRAD